MRAFRSLCLLLSALLLAPWAWAAESPAELTAEEWLRKLGPALNTTSYRGVFVYTRGDQVNAMHIVHRYRNGEVQERLVPQDGESGEILRKGNRVTCILPEHGRFHLDAVIPSGPFAEAFSSQFVPVSRWYQATLLEPGRVAGHKAAVVELNARDPHRYSYRIWLEKNTGLLIKSDVREGGDGRVLERFQFTSLEITNDLHDSEFEIQGSGKTVEHTLGGGPWSSSTRHLEGWRLGWRPEGFMPAATPRTRASGQAVAFSDGLASFSIFVEAFSGTEMPTGASRIGATTAYMRMGQVDTQRYLVTVVGEIPPATARKVADSVEVIDALKLFGRGSHD